ncbi:MAG: amidohydrolase [Candidatus Lokiarchaeota archaeon]|nr:amidohydrolase [Candidatus Lokiarchaeota archaeon]
MTTMDNKILYGGIIITINNTQPYVEAVGIKGDKIASIGTLEEVKVEMGENSELIHLKGKTLLPGFIDSHIHAIGSIFLLLYPSLKNIKNLKDLQNLLKKEAFLREPDELLIAFDLDEEKLENPIIPTKWELDEACPDTPVFIFRHDLHIGVANSKLLEILNINKDTVAPEGGEIRRNSKGEITGVLTENAINKILGAIRLPDSKIIRESADKFFYSLAEKGITSIHGVLELDRKGGVENLGGVALPILKLIQENILQNYYGIFFTATPKKILKIKKPPLDEKDEFSKFKVGCLKAWLDGSFGAYTACLFEPFTNQPENSGYCVIEETILYERMVKAHNVGLQIAIHAIGDKANKLVVDLYEKLLEENPRDNHRHRIEHASMLTPEVIKRIKKLNLIASCQPTFILSEFNWLEKRFGANRCKITYPFKSLVDAGIVIASGSDGPVEDPNPILGLHAMVNREGFVPEESISIEEALKTYTINGAYAAFEEDVKGSIEVGKLADFAILDRNPLEIPKDEIKQIQVVETIIRGKTVYKMQS